MGLTKHKQFVLMVQTQTFSIINWKQFLWQKSFKVLREGEKEKNDYSLMFCFGDLFKMRFFASKVNKFRRKFSRQKREIFSKKFETKFCLLKVAKLMLWTVSPVQTLKTHPKFGIWWCLLAKKCIKLIQNFAIFKILTLGSEISGLWNRTKSNLKLLIFCRSLV